MPRPRKLDPDAFPQLWEALTPPQQRLVIALNSFTLADCFSYQALSDTLGRKSVKGVERIIRKLVDAGLYSKLRHGKPGGGRASNSLALANIDDPALAAEIASNLRKANGHAIAGQKGNGHALLNGKGNGHMENEKACVRLPSTCVRLVAPSDNDSAAAVPGPVSENSSGRASGTPIVANNHTLQVLSTVTEGQAGGPATTPTCAYTHSSFDPVYTLERDLEEHLLDLNAPRDDELSWYESQGDVEEEPVPFRMLAIDPSSLTIGWACIGGPVPAYRIDGGCEFVPGGDNVFIRAEEAGKFVAKLIPLQRPSFILIEKPDFQKKGIDLMKLETFHKSFERIDHAVRHSGIRYDYAPASQLTRGMNNQQKQLIKETNVERCKRLTGRLVSEHEGDAIVLGVDYLQRWVQSLQG